MKPKPTEFVLPWTGLKIKQYSYAGGELDNYTTTDKTRKKNPREQVGAVPSHSPSGLQVNLEVPAVMLYPESHV